MKHFNKICKLLWNLFLQWQLWKFISAFLTEKSYLHDQFPTLNSMLKISYWSWRVGLHQLFINISVRKTLILNCESIHESWMTPALGLADKWQWVNRKTHTERTKYQQTLLWWKVYFHRPPGQVNSVKDYLWPIPHSWWAVATCNIIN